MAQIFTGASFALVIKVVSIWIHAVLAAALFSGFTGLVAIMRAAHSVNEAV
jgi:hypothetical protein